MSEAIEYPLIEIALTIGTWDVVDFAWPDTGFEGGVAIPTGAGREVLAEPGVKRIRLADGSMRSVPTWDGTVEIEGRTFDAEVIALGDRYLVGLEVLNQLDICFEFGQRVRLRFRDE